MALYRLARHGAGAAPIRRALLVGDPVTAADALALHLVDEVTGDPAAALARAAERAAAFYPDLAIRRQLMFDAATTGFEEALGAHLAACDRELRRTTLGAAS